MILCPECGDTTDGSDIGRHADSFCDECDFPLFWASVQMARTSDDDSDDAQRRLPGTGGRHLLVSATCPTCGEQNDPDNIECDRCGNLMVPEPEPVVVPKPVPPPPVAVEEAKPFPWKWVILALLIVLALIILGVILL